MRVSYIYFIFYSHTLKDFSIFFVPERLYSLELIVFSLLLPRLSTSFTPHCQKTQLSGMSLGPMHRKRGTGKNR